MCSSRYANHLIAKSSLLTAGFPFQMIFSVDALAVSLGLVQTPS